MGEAQMSDYELKFKPYKSDLFKHYSVDELTEMQFDKSVNVEDFIGNTLTSITERMNEAGEKLLLEVANPFIPLLREQGISERDVERIARSIAIEVVRCPTKNDKWMKKLALYSGTPYYGSKLFGGYPETIHEGNAWYTIFPDELICHKCGKRHMPEDNCPDEEAKNN